MKINEKVKNIWESFEVTDSDIEFIFNRLFEIETPTKTLDIVKLLIDERIRLEKNHRENLEKSKGDLYLPKDDFQVGQKLLFPALDFSSGEVVGIREGNNPELETLKIIQVEFAQGLKKEFAANLQNHFLNDAVAVLDEETDLDKDKIFANNKIRISQSLIEKLEKSQDLVQIAGYWFPRSLLIDINIGYLNLAEAVLEMAEGGPLTSPEIIEQIELPTDSNQTLTEFSLNLALQEDARFDEVGPAGETLWFLHRSEPDNVRSQPIFLLPEDVNNYDDTKYSDYLTQMNAGVFDELEYSKLSTDSNLQDVTISIIYPHLVSGTLPLSANLENLFPTAYESPRIRFTFVDGETKEKFAGWVVREKKYVYGLKEWYKKNEVIPGSLIHIKQGKNPGEVIVAIGKKRSTREWVRTVGTNPDGKISFSVTQQQISTDFDERMTFSIINFNQIERLWEKYQKVPAEKVIINFVRELAKLNPQGHVHAQELYAAFNFVKRVSPGYILHLLENCSEVEHLGDLYFRIRI